ncbi:MAG: phosphohistidine phosphatase SixA, partial [Leptolyngbya sp. SIO3F4]|nr:phosphohistidine phosphatase SixA [Leptolyngbya sp. SIO3F4]
YDDDRKRPLIEKGVLKTKRVAQRLVSLGLRVDILLTSPLVRAVQTAELFCQQGLAEDYLIFKPLAPDGNLGDLLAWLKTWQSVERTSIALIGHEPDLSQWAQQLVHGTKTHKWVLKKAGIIGLEIPNSQNAIGHSRLFWLAPPRFII